MSTNPVNMEISLPEKGRSQTTLTDLAPKKISNKAQEKWVKKQQIGKKYKIKENGEKP